MRSALPDRSERHTANWTTAQPAERVEARRFIRSAFGQETSLGVSSLCSSLLLQGLALSRATVGAQFAPTRFGVAVELSRRTVMAMVWDKCFGIGAGKGANCGRL